MKIILAIAFLMVVSFRASSQDRWAYAWASLMSDSGEVYYVSDVINLEALPCAIDPDRHEGDRVIVDTYRKCLTQWFYDRIKRSGEPGSTVVELRDVSAAFEQHTDYTRLFRKKPMNLTFNKPDDNYMTHAIAVTKREQDVAYCRPGDCIVIYVR